MRDKLKQTIFLFIGLIILILLILKSDISLSSLSHVKYIHYVFFAAVILLVNPINSAFRMKYFLLIVDDVPNSFTNLIEIEYMNKFFIATIPAKLHVPIKAILLNKICKLNLRDGISITTLEYALDTSVILLLAFAGMLLLFKNLQYMLFREVTIFLILIIVFVAIFFSMPSSIFDKYIQRLENKSSSTLKKILVGLLKVLKTIKETWRNLIFSEQIHYVSFFTILRWIFFVLSFKILFLSVDYNVPFIWILFVAGGGLFMGGITAIPGGLGVREAAMVLLFGELNIPYTISVVVVLINRLLLIVPITIGYILSLRTGLSIYKDRKNIVEIGNEL